MSSKFIYFEKQDIDFMSGQHALNMLFQKYIFNIGMLSEAASAVDAKERRLGIQNTTQNVSDHGFFSIQVLQEVTKRRNIHLVDFSCPEFIEQAFDAVSSRAFLVNKNQHWFALRRFGPYWFILNSLFEGPRYISNYNFSLYISQMASARIDIYHVIGNLPECNADRAVRDKLLYPDLRVVREVDLTTVVESGKDAGDVVAKAVQLSIQEAEGEETEQSLEPPARPLTIEEIRQKRIERFGKS